MPVDEGAISREARLLALEYLAMHTYNMVLLAIKVPEIGIASAEKDGLVAIGQRTIGRAGPAMSDHIAGEIQDRLSDLLADARIMREAGRTAE